MSVVSISRCASYERERVRSAVAACLDRIDGLGELLEGKRVLVKPNLLSSTASPDVPVNTHPEVLRAVVGLLIARWGCSVVIGDSCGTLAPGATQRALMNSGVFEVADELGAEVVNFDTCPHERVTNPRGRYVRAFNVARPVLTADVVVSVPKFKTHQLTSHTGAVKNMLGVVPGRGKKTVHVRAPKPDAMGVALVDIYEMVTPHLTVTDGVVGMEGNGPNGGRARQVGLIIASRDGVALDAVAGAIMGFEPSDVVSTVAAHQRGLGTMAIDRIEIKGETLAAVRIPDFRKPINFRRSPVVRIVPTRLVRWLIRHMASYRSRVNHGRCVLCRECVRNCPAGALAVVSARVVCDAERCIACYCCEEVCDYGAIRVVRSPMGRGIELAKDLILPHHWLGNLRRLQARSRRRGDSDA